MQDKGASEKNQPGPPPFVSQGIEFRVVGTAVALGFYLLASVHFREVLLSLNGLYIVGGSIVFSAILSQIYPWADQERLRISERIWRVVLSPLWLLGIFTTVPFAAWGALIQCFHRGRSSLCYWELLFCETVMLLSLEVISILPLLEHGIENRPFSALLVGLLLIPLFRSLKELFVKQSRNKVFVRNTYGRGSLRSLVGVLAVAVPLGFAALSWAGLLEAEHATELAIVLVGLIVHQLRAGLQFSVSDIPQSIGSVDEVSRHSQLSGGITTALLLIAGGIALWQLPDWKTGRISVEVRSRRGEALLPASVLRDQLTIYVLANSPPRRTLSRPPTSSEFVTQVESAARDQGVVAIKGDAQLLLRRGKHYLVVVLRGGKGVYAEARWVTVTGLEERTVRFFPSRWFPKAGSKTRKAHRAYPH